MCKIARVLLLLSSTYSSSKTQHQKMEQRPNRNAFGYLDWTTGLMLSDSFEVYQQQSQPQPQQQSLQSPVLQQPHVVQLHNSSLNYTPGYSVTPADVVALPGTSYQDLPPNCIASQSSVDSSFSHYNRFSLNHSENSSTDYSSFLPAATSDSVSVINLEDHRFNEGPLEIAMSALGRGLRNKERSSKKRNTSAVTELLEDSGGRSYKHHRSVSSSVTDFDDLQNRFTRDGSEDEDATQDDARMSPTSSPTLSEGPRKGVRQNHSEIEKRRRDKMNTYISELSRVVPMCITMSHKLDKLTVLRMAVQHLKTIRGAIHSYTEGDYKPAFLSDEELKRLILQSADGFLFVVGCDRGRILYVSESVSQVLNYSQGDLLGQSWFDILHPKDVAKIKEQLSSSDLSPRERLIDAKTMLPVKTDMPQGLSRLCPGARRSFFCRMKCKTLHSVKEENEANPGCSKQRKSQSVSKEKRYVVVHCTGYLKSWAPAKIGMHDQDAEGDLDACNLSCLVAVGRVQPSALPPMSLQFTTSNSALRSGKSPQPPSIEFISRHAIDGKFVFVDQRATLLLGLLPQEMLGTSMYEYYHIDDISALTEAHKAALQSNETVTTAVYRFRVKEGSYIRLQSRWKSFRNPWTKEIECLVAKNGYIMTENNECSNFSSDLMTNSCDVFSPGTPAPSVSSNTPTRVRLFSMELEASKIGQAVADEVLDSHRRSCSSASISSSAGPSPGSMLSVSATASPFSNVGSPLDPDGGVLVASVLASSFNNEESRRSALGMANSAASSNVPNANSSGGNQSGTNEIQRNSTVPYNNSNSGTSSSSSSIIGGSNNNHHTTPNHINIRNNTQLMHILNEAGLHADEDMMEVIGGLMMDQSQSPSQGAMGPGDGNDEAAMAVVMSLLEADAGLGGPVDFSGLPWPLP